MSYCQEVVLDRGWGPEECLPSSTHSLPSSPSLAWEDFLATKTSSLVFRYYVDVAEINTLYIRCLLRKRAKFWRVCNAKWNTAVDSIRKQNIGLWLWARTTRVGGGCPETTYHQLPTWNMPAAAGQVHRPAEIWADTANCDWDHHWGQILFRTEPNVIMLKDVTASLGQAVFTNFYKKLSFLFQLTWIIERLIWRAIWSEIWASFQLWRPPHASGSLEKDLLWDDSHLPEGGRWAAEHQCQHLEWRLATKYWGVVGERRHWRA